MAVFRDLNRDVEWTLPYIGFTLYALTIISTRFPLAQLAVGIALVGLLFQRGRFRAGPFATWMAAFLAWSCVGMLTTVFPDEVTKALQDFGKVFLIAFVGANALRSRAQIRMLIVLMLVAFALYPGRGSYLNYITGANVVFGRVIWNGVYANPNDLAAITLLMVGLCTSVIGSEPNGLLKRGALVGNVLLVLLITFTQSRGVLLGLAFMGLFALWRTKWRQRIRLIATMAVLGMVAIPFTPPAMWERLKGLEHVADSNDMATVDPEGSARQRYEIWKVATGVISDNPIIGVGFGAYPRAHQRMARRPGYDPIARGARDTHSTYLNVIAETGIIGFMLLGGLYWSVFRYAERVRRRIHRILPTESRRLLAIELGLASFLFAGFWGSYAKLNVTYLMLVILWAGAKILEKEFPPPPRFPQRRLLR